MATKLKNLHLRKVDVVDEGANPRADIALKKSRDPQEDEPADSTKQENLIKRFFAWLRNEGAESDVEKGMSFNDELTCTSMEAVMDEVFDVVYALRSSLNSILCDGGTTPAGKASAMAESVNQFTEAMQGLIPIWAQQKLALKDMVTEKADNAEVALMKSDQARLADKIEKAKAAKKGEPEDMIKIDKSKMTPEERAAYEELVKKYAVDAPEEKEEPAVEKAKAKTSKADPDGDVDEEDIDEEEQAEKKTSTKKSVSAPAEEGIYKGLDPAVKAELEELKKFRAEMELQQLIAVAKKYEVIGKKPEELAKSLKVMKDAGGTAYADMIATLDEMVAMQDASGIMSEIGKSGHGNTGKAGESEAVAKATSIAKSYMEKDPSLNFPAAIAKAWEDNPDLMDAYEAEEGF